MYREVYRGVQGGVWRCRGVQGGVEVYREV